jgi:hypothetical protein
VRDQVWHPYTTTGKIIVFCVSIAIFYRKYERLKYTKRFKCLFFVWIFNFVLLREVREQWVQEIVALGTCPFEGSTWTVGSGNSGTRDMSFWGKYVNGGFRK